MKRYIKSIVNGILAPIDLKVNRIHRGIISGVELFPDLRILINKESPVCLDVGANKGQTIDYLQRHLNNPYIYSFEPSSEIFNALTDKDHGENVFLFNHALGAIEKEREFINYDDPCLSSFLPLDISKENRYRNIEENSREMVQIRTVDSFISQQRIKNVDLLKTDTQGFDLEVLLGAEKSLKAGIIDYVLIEINFVDMYTKQARASDIIRLLEQHGLHLIDYYEKVRQHNTLAWCTALFGKR